MTKERYQNLKKIHEAEGNSAYCLHVFGDTLAKREKYPAGLDGIDAIHFYLIHKFHWLPRDVKAMSYEDLLFVLSQELEGWTLPPEARV